MVPKKLTDCPENLRESIDWLIQVKNGGDGDGLGKLADALKMWIGGAIENATKSFDKREEQLNCSHKLSGQHTEYCKKLNEKIEAAKTPESSDNSRLLKAESDLQKHLDTDHSLTDDARKKQLSDINQSRIQLGTLAGQLGSFIGGGQEVEKAMQKARDIFNDRIKELENKHNDCDCCQNPLALPGCCDCDEHNEIRSLEEKHDGIKTHKKYADDSTKKYLDNLCSGLEKFLGFNSASKGYDGTGIVYSDLDRLCDGVMAFLHGVFSNIQDHLGQHKETLTPVIKLLNEKKHAGKNGFNAAIAKVVAGVGRYNEKVEQSNTKINDVINKYTANVDKLKNELSKLLETNSHADDFDAVQAAVTSVDSKLKEREQLVKAFTKNMASVKREIIDLKDKLQLKITTARENIGYENLRFKTLPAKEKDRLQEMERKIRTCLEQIGIEVKSGIRTKVDLLVDKLKALVKKIYDKLQSIDKMLLEYVQKLEAWIKNVDQCIAGALYKIETILQAVNDSAQTGNPKLISDAVQQIETETNLLHNAASKAKIEVEKEVTTALKEVIAMNSSLLGDLKDAKHNINTAIKRYVDNLGKAIREGIEKAKEPWDENKNGVKTLKENLGDTDGEFYKLLDGNLVNGKNYASNLEWVLHGIKENLHRHFKLIMDSALTDAVAKDLQKPVGEHIGSDSTTTSMVVDISQHTTIFVGYKRHVEQPTPTESNTKDLKGKLPQAINKIEQQVTSALTDIQHIKDAIVGRAGDVVGKLTELCSAISSAGVSTRFSLNEFKTNSLNGSEADQLAGIKIKMESLRMEDLGDAITWSYSFINAGANALREDYVKQMQSQVDVKVSETKNELTKQARKNYVSSIKLLLTEFTAKVHKELGDLPKEIIDDAKKSFKGFMGQMHSEMSNYLPNAVTTNLSAFSPSINNFLTNIIYNINGNRDILPMHDATMKLHDSLQTLFNNLTKYDTTFERNLSSLASLLSIIHPQSYDEGRNTLLDVLKKGIGNLHDELGKAYISVYDDAKIDWAAEYNPEKEKCARACLTIVPTLVAALTQLKNVLESNNGKRKNYKIYDLKGSSHSLRTLFFGDNGYDVGLPDDFDYGELNHRDDCIGERILKHLTEGEHALFASSDAASKLNPSPSLDGPTVAVENVDGVVSQLHNYLALYFKVRHITHIPKLRAPCNIYEMLQWCCGLQFNSVYDGLHKHCASLFKKKKDSNTNTEISLPIKAYPKSISRYHVGSAIHHITSRAYFLLTGILGHGDAECGYACELSDNSLHLKYPTSGADCLHTLLDILRRLFPALQFLQRRCSEAATDFGWGDCLYGKGVRTSNTLCNEHSTNEVTCQANSRPDCQSNSPLMSYLNDCLPGHLPHQMVDVSCQSTCKTCPNNLPGQPCITPLGFRGFSSSVKTGRDLRDIIHEFLDHEHLPALFCLTAKPPSTLPEHFEFALSLVSCWQYPTMSNRSGIKQAVESSIGNQSIDLYKNPGDLTAALTRCYGADCSNCEHSHITNLTSSGYCSRGSKDIPRSPYLSSLCSNTYLYLAEMHSNAYLSWAIYLPWNFHKYLEIFLQAFSEIFCGEWGCRSCLKSANCKRGKHGHSDMDEKTKTDKPYCQCTSVVTCKGVTPTLYSYGFSFADISALHEEETRKTCTNFYDSFKEVVESKYFTDLFNECDTFLWKIREPFSYLVLVLWSLSLLYLLYVSIGRLDTLHIKSHLRSLSSHRVAAQSLLATARIGKLAKISYLQA